MNLIFLFFLFFNFSLETEYFDNYGYLKRGEIMSINISYQCVYINASEFSGYSSINVQFTVKNGYFAEKKIYIGSTEEEPEMEASYGLPHVIESVSSYSGNFDGIYYDNYTLNFEISYLSNVNYYLISIPEFEGDNVEMICNPSGISVGAVIGIIAGIVAVIIIAVILFFRFYKRKKITNPIDSGPLVPNDINPSESPFSINWE